jgi:hypothetical protein
MEQAAIVDQLAEDMDADLFMSVVREAADRDLEALLASEHRERVLDEIFGQMPDRLRPDKVRGLDAVIHWRVEGGAGGGEDVYEVTIRDGACRVDKSPAQQPRVTFRIEPAAFLKLIAGTTSGMKLVLGRKLTVQGDVQLAMRVERLFERG